MWRTLSIPLAAVVLLVGVSGIQLYGSAVKPVLAAGSSDDNEGDKLSSSPDWKAGNSAIEEGNWDLAIMHFSKVVDADRGNAEAQNMLGYSFRKSGNFDLALKHYKKALNINPKHKGAHAYIGEAYLERGNLAKAEEHLARLDDICTFGCREYRSLKKAVGDYKKAQKN